ncbi:hypothetical protein RSSM_00664 [Rhodopirellula sallentina SM41]|uniref:Uncharacterized protein n=1 Tax=Rhodopirellula sallentina SM41 TaxID=1263870 RepID=M5UJ72_9BACT|nr:hypothetical protein RSSM_00664 [Rhodopirellula sallentina SM41]
MTVARQIIDERPKQFFLSVRPNIVVRVLSVRLVVERVLGNPPLGVRAEDVNVSNTQLKQRGCSRNSDRQRSEADLIEA